MALEQKLHLKLAQRLVMTPTLQQAIKLLQLSRLELEQALEPGAPDQPGARARRGGARRRGDGGAIPRTNGDGDGRRTARTTGEPSATRAPSLGGGTATPSSRSARRPSEASYGEVELEALFTQLPARLAASRVDVGRRAKNRPSRTPPTPEASMYDSLVEQLRLERVASRAAADLRLRDREPRP